jgi:hypothetical protein
MAESYVLSFQDLVEQISGYSPRSAQLLQMMQEQFCPKTAYYAAFILVCLRAESEIASSKPLASVTPQDLANYSFFDFARDNPPALASFNDLLQCFKSEQTATAGSAL